MGISDFLALLPDDLKYGIRDGIIDAVASQTEKVPGGEKVVKAIRQLSSEASFNNALDKAMVGAIRRFEADYKVRDEDLQEAIVSDGIFWQSKDVRRALTELV